MKRKHIKTKEPAGGSGGSGGGGRKKIVPIGRGRDPKATAKNPVIRKLTSAEFAGKPKFDAMLTKIKLHAITEKTASKQVGNASKAVMEAKKLKDAGKLIKANNLLTVCIKELYKTKIQKLQAMLEAGNATGVDKRTISDIVESISLLEKEISALNKL